MATENKEKTVNVRLPRLPGVDGAGQEFFSVNGKNYLIARGKSVEVPVSVAEVIENGNLAEDAAIEYAGEKALKEP